MHSKSNISEQKFYRKHIIVTMTTKKICIDVRMAFHSGIGTYIRNILPFISRANFSLQVLAPHAVIQKWPALAGYDVIPVGSSIYSIQEQIELPLKIPTCDLFWSPHYNIPLAPIRAKKRLVTIHDVNHLAMSSTLSMLKRGYAKIMLPQAASRSNHVITISNFSKNEMVKWLGADEKKVSVIHLGARQEKPTSQEHANYFLFVGSRAPHKNLERLLRAWRRVVAKFPDRELVVVGNKTETALSTNVRCLGHVSEEELERLYRGAYALIFPSLYEGFGFPPLEAMRLGCPTIVSNAASVPEVCGDASLYVDPLSEEDMAQKICALIENPSMRETLIDKGMNRIKQFSWEKTAQDHINVINRLI